MADRMRMPSSDLFALPRRTTISGMPTSMPDRRPPAGAGEASCERDLAQTVRAAMDRSAYEASRGQRPSARVVHGPPSRIWELLTERLMRRSELEYLGFDDPSVLAGAGMSERMLGQGESAMTGMVDRGVQVKQVTTEAGIRFGGARNPAIPWERGGSARVAPALPFKACVLDRRVALLPLDLAFLTNGMVVVTDGVVVDAIVAAHRQLWATGLPPSAGSDGPPAHLQDLLHLLSSGATDDNAARRLGLSPRTYSRRVAELLTLLGATSRFDAGARAQRRGWL